MKIIHGWEKKMRLERDDPPDSGVVLSDAPFEQRAIAVRQVVLRSRHRRRSGVVARIQEARHPRDKIVVPLSTSD